MAKIKYTKKGQPYQIMSNGRARFLKKTTTNLRGVKMAKRVKRSYGKVRRYTPKSNSILGLNTNTIWQGVGAGTGGLLGGILNQYIPVGTNMAQGVAGLGLSYMGKGAIKQAGKGMIIASIGKLVEDNLVPMIMGSQTNNGSNNWWQ